MSDETEVIETTRFGRLEVPVDSVYTFETGILGFPNVSRYVIRENPSGGPFEWLQSVERGDLAFVIIDPLTFKSDYTVDFPKSEAEKLGISDSEQGFVRVIVTVGDNPEDMTANLKGPLIFNPENRIATQIVLTGEEYTTKHWIFPGPDQEPGEPATTQDS